MKKNLLLGSFCLSLLLGCASTKSPKYNPQEFDTINYQTNMENAIDAIDLLKDFEQTNVPVAQVSTTDFATLMQADVYFNQSDYAHASPLYNDLAYRYRDPRTIYKAIVCLEHLKLTLVQATDLNNLIALFIQVDPQSNLAKIFQVRTALTGSNAAAAISGLDYLVQHNPAQVRAIFLGMSAIISNDMALDDNQGLSTFSDYVVMHYTQYPEANLLAAIGFAITGADDDLQMRLNYIHATYPSWQVPLYWVSGILARGHNELVLQLLGKALESQNSADPILQNMYISSLITFNQMDVAQTYLQQQLNLESTSVVESSLTASTTMISSNKDNVLIDLGMLYTKTGDYATALKYLGSAHPANPIVQNIVNMLMASIYDYTGDVNNAVTYYQKVSNSNQYLVQIANLMLLNDYFIQKNYTAVDTYLNKMAKDNGLDEKQALLLKASYYIGAGEYQMAYNMLQANFATLGVADSEYIYQYASMAAMLKHTDQAIKLYKDYIIAEPDEVHGYNDLAYVYADQTQNYKLAYKYANKALVMAPLDPSVQDTYGWVLYKQGKYSEAYAYIQTAYGQLKDPEVSKHLQAVYRQLQRADLAAATVVPTRLDLQQKIRQQLLERSLRLLMYVQFGIQAAGFGN